MQSLHFPFQIRHAIYHGIEGSDGLCRRGFPVEGVIGGFLERGEDMVAGVFKGTLQGLEVFAGELVGESEERLFLVEVVSRSMWSRGRALRGADGSRR